MISNGLFSHKYLLLPGFSVKARFEAFIVFPQLAIFWAETTFSPLVLKEFTTTAGADTSELIRWQDDITFKQHQLGHA